MLEIPVGCGVSRMLRGVCLALSLGTAVLLCSGCGDGTGDATLPPSASTAASEGACSPTLVESADRDAMIGDLLDSDKVGLHLVYDTRQEGIDRVRGQWPELDELLKREDVSDLLVGYYADLDLVEARENFEFPTLSVTLLESLLAQPEVLDCLESDGRAELAEAIVAQWYTKFELGGGDEFGIINGAFPAVRLLQVDSDDFRETVRSSTGLESFAALGRVDLLTDADLGVLDTVPERLTAQYSLS